MVSQNVIDIAMAQRPKIRVPVGKKGEMTLLNRSNLPEAIEERIEMPFSGDNIKVTTESGKIMTVDENGKLKEIGKKAEKEKKAEAKTKVEAKTKAEPEENITFTKKELEDKSFKELRELGETYGVKDRSKKNLIKEILAEIKKGK